MRKADTHTNTYVYTVQVQRNDFFSPTISINSEKILYDIVWSFVADARAHI